MHSKPRWEHNCDRCLFVGFMGESDVYVCDRVDIVEVVVRHSNDVLDYWSGSAIKPEKK